MKRQQGNLIFGQGRMVENGTHQELLANEDVYSELFHKQMTLSETEG